MFRVFRLGIRCLSSLPNLRETGFVKRFSKEKGFGFIKRDSNGQDLFVHYQSIVGKGFQTLEEGQQVEFQVHEGNKGLEARDVHVKKPVSDEKKSIRMSNTEKYTGVIRKFVKSRGFGFITRKSDGADLFVHARSILPDEFDRLTEGTEVEFIEHQTNRGLEAKNIRIKTSNT